MHILYLTKSYLCKACLLACDGFITRLCDIGLGAAHVRQLEYRTEAVTLYIYFGASGSILSSIHNQVNSFDAHPISYA